MGNSASTGSARRKLGDAIQTHVFQRSLPEPLKPHEIEVLNKLAEREQQRLSELPSLEEINRKDAGFGNLLDKLGTSISGRAVDVTGTGAGSAGGASSAPAAGVSSAQGEQRHAGPSGQGRPHRTRAPGAQRNGVPQDEDAGRMPSYLLKQALEARTAAAKAGGSFDTAGFARSISVDGSLLEQLMRHACLPEVAKVETFGHQYAFARAPQWWSQQGSGAAQQAPDPMAKMIRPKPITDRNGQDDVADSNSASRRS